MKYHDIQLTGSLQVTGSLSIPVGTTAERPTNPKSGSLRLNSSNGRMEIYTAVSGSQWEVVGAQTAAAAVADPTNLEYLLIAGGAGGAIQHGGGGGAGGYLSSSLNSVTSGSSWTVTVGGAGAGGIYNSGNASGTDGVDSIIAGMGVTITAAGGGGGSSYATQTVPGNGGSGGGGGNQTSGTQSGGSGTAGQGNNGGDGSTSSTNYPSGGGGGAGAVGGNASAGVGGNGGVGKRSNITGTLTYYAGGGGSATYQGGTPGTGGQGGGATGISAGSTNGNNATTNTGGGGSGGNGGGGYYGGSGGAGVSIFAYPTGSINGGGGIVGTTSSGKKYHQFNSSGTLTLGGANDFQIPKQSNLSLLWRPDDFSSRGTSTVTDLSGNSRNGTVSGATLGNNPYYTFNGSNTKIYNSLTRPNSAQTLIAWMRFDGDGSAGYSLTGWQEGGSYNYLGRQNNGNIYYYMGNATGGQISYTMTNGTWYMITSTVDLSGDHTVYVDTTARATNSSINMGSNGSIPLTVGAIGSTSNHFHNGLIGTVAFYTTNFLQADVTEFYNSTKHNFV